MDDDEARDREVRRAEFNALALRAGAALQGAPSMLAVSMTRIIVCGSRDWRDFERVREVLDALLAQRGPFTLVHGACATGADSIARAWGVGVVQLEPHPADWKAGHVLSKSGDFLSPGPARNETMADLGADLCLAFWDGRSRGTRDMIRRAVAHGIPVRIVAPIDPVLALGPEVY